MRKVRVEVSQPYEVLIGSGLLNEAAQHLHSFIDERKVYIVTDENVEKHGYLDLLIKTIEPEAVITEHLILPAGEAQKSMANVSKIIGDLADLNFSRDDILIALGGGVIGDLTGFAASIYLRGIDYIQIPTTFLAAIDSSVGGKTAVDLPQGKNLVGAFHHPACVLCDVDTFQTLLPEVFEDGCSELIKYAMIMNPELLEYLMNRKNPLTAEDAEVSRLVEECVSMKKQVVLEDEFDLGLRQLLNYGHTLGHAIEQVSKYQVSHGRGVAAGMLVFMKIALEQGHLKEDFSQDFRNLLNSYHLLEEKPNYSSRQLTDAMMNDKKRRRQQMTVVLPVSYGKSDLIKVPVNTLTEWVDREWQNYEIN